MENCKINEATKDYWEEYLIFREANKHKDEDYLSYHRFIRYMKNKETQKNNENGNLTYDQWYQVVKDEEFENLQLYQERKANKELIEVVNREKSEYEVLQNEIMGKFHFNIYKDLLSIDLEPQYLTRFVYLCCFLDFNDSKVKWGKSNNKDALVKDLGLIWGLSERECRNTKNALIEKVLITINEDKTISINKKYAFKGKGKKNMRGSVKMFDNGFKEIYEQATSKEHKRLGILIKILPLVNYKWNLVCTNPEETDKDKIIPLSLKDLCRVVGYDENNSNKLKRELLKVEVSGNSVICIHTMKNGNIISINPKVYYKGNSIEALEYLCTLFDIAMNK